MNKLIFLHNYVTSTISWIICNENYKLIDKGQADSLSTLKDKDVDEIQAVILSTDFQTKLIEVPPVGNSQILRSIPFLLEDHLLDPINKYHFINSERDIDGEVLVSLVPKDFMELIDSSFIVENLSVKSMAPLESSLHIVNKTCYLAIFKDIAVIIFGSKWSWCAETETILTLMDKGIKEYGCDKLKVFLDEKDTKLDLSLYSELKPVIELVENDLDFLEKNLETISPKINLLVDRYSPRIQWKKFLFNWRYALTSLSLVFFLYFTQFTVDILQNSYAAENLEQESKRLFFTSFPNESKDIDLSILIKKKLKGIAFSRSEPFLQTLSNVSEVVVNHERTSLFSVTYDVGRAQFIIEVQCIQYDDLEALQSTLSQGGYDVEIGISKKIGESILSEMYLKKT
ncbi:MAG: hypothetical protein CMD42_02960 [Gammaproteobacteria bacterium]|nr:hypothetical protein [Gammaproteobacteria bacterium]